jgi:hypothetical protein
MTILSKSILAALAGAAAVWASAAGPYDGYGRYDDRYGYSYDRYRYDYRRYRGDDAPVYVQPGDLAPYRDPLRYWDPELRAWVYHGQDPRELEARREFERAQRGDYDGSSPHPHSKAYSPG